MSVLTSNSRNRLLKSDSIRTGKSLTRNEYLAPYDENAFDNSFTLASFALRIFAICGLFLAGHFLFRLEPPALTAKQINSAHFSVRNGSGAVARANGSLESLNEDTIGHLLAGDMIVADHGAVWLSFPHGQSVALESGASVTVEQLEIENEIQRVQLIVWSGRIQYTAGVENNVEDYFYVSSTSSSSQIRAGSMSVEVLDLQKTRYVVIDGTATIEMGGQTVQLHASQHLDAILGELLVIDIDASPIVEAVIAKSPARSTLASVASASVASALVASSSVANTQLSSDEFELAVETYVVKTGDTIWSIAMRYGVDMDSIINVNPVIIDSNFLSIGQQLLIPTDFAVSTEIGTN